MQVEEEQAIDETNLLQSYNLASMLFVLLFVDNLLRWRRKRCSGTLEILVLFGVLSLAAQFLSWSGIVAVEQRPGG